MSCWILLDTLQLENKLYQLLFFLQLVPYRLSFCQSVLRSHGHWKCLLLTLLIHSCSGLLGWCYFSVRKVHVYLRQQAFYSGTNEPVVHTSYYYQNTCESGYIYIPVCFLVMFYLIYLIEAWNCPTRTLLLHAVDVSTALGTIKKLRRAVPLLWWRILCYHYVRRRRSGTPRYRAGVGNGHSSASMPHTYFERVNTQTRTASFDFGHCGCRDASQGIGGLDLEAATLILFSKGFSFACTEAEREFEEQRAIFFTESEAHDDYMETREGRTGKGGILLVILIPESFLSLCANGCLRVWWLPRVLVYNYWGTCFKSAEYLSSDKTSTNF